MHAHYIYIYIASRASIRDTVYLCTVFAFECDGLDRGGAAIGSSAHWGTSRVPGMLHGLHIQTQPSAYIFQWPWCARGWLWCSGHVWCAWLVMASDALSICFVSSCGEQSLQGWDGAVLQAVCRCTPVDVNNAWPIVSSRDLPKDHPLILSSHGLSTEPARLVYREGFITNSQSVASVFPECRVSCCMCLDTFPQPLWVISERMRMARLSWTLVFNRKQGQVWLGKTVHI